MHVPSSYVPFAPHRRVRGRLLLVLVLGLALAACGPRRDPADLDITLPEEVPDGLQLGWEQVSGADSYRLVFMRMTGAPVCTLRVDAAKHPGYLLRRDSLPAGLSHGWQMTLEVRAMRHGDPMAATGIRPLKTP